MRASCGVTAGFAAVLVILVAGAAEAQQDSELPSGKLGFSLGVRQGAGQLGDDFGIGLTGAIEAGYHPTRADRRLSTGLHWSVGWSWFGPDDDASVAGSLKLLDFNFGVRLRILLGEGTPRFLFLGTGVSLLRSNVPIPPNDERTYFGPYAAFGAEWFSQARYHFSFEARYGLIAGGPGSVTISVGLGFGR